MAKICSVQGCSRVSKKRTWCLTHYGRWHRYGDVMPEKPLKTQNSGNKCAVEECERSAHSKGWCRMHYMRWYKTGSTDPTRGSWYQPLTNKNGYVLVWMPDHPFANKDTNRVAEHRVVMENIIGRYLLPGENVHHKNGVRNDNRPENLELWVVSQPAGQRPNDLVVWAKEILDRYDNEIFS